MENGFSLCRGSFYYCSETNTLIDSQLKETFSRYSQNDKINFKNVSVTKETILSRLKNLKQLIFETTQNCNLRCKYCTYNSGEYFYNRGLSEKNLDFQLAAKAIDYVYGFVKDRKKKEFIIGFYGGEPILNFEVIKQIVDYSKAKFGAWKLIFTITTNGTLLTDENIHFFIKNSFNVLLSLDGPRENNDSKRVFPGGAGSFSLIMKNLEKIKSINEEFFLNNVSFSIVYSKDLSLESLFDFFSKEPLVIGNVANIGFVTESNTSYFKNYKYDRTRLKKERTRLFENIALKKKQNIDLTNIESSYVSMHSIIQKALNKREFNILAGTCCYDSRLFVSAEGQYHICEKLNDKFAFGDIENGFNFPKMIDIVNDYIGVIKEFCAGCEIRCLCLRCYANLAKNGKFEIDKTFCKNNKYTTKKVLEEIIRLNEAGVCQ